MKSLCLVLATMALGACATLGLSGPKDSQEAIAQANVTLTSVIQGSDQSLLNHTMTSDQAEHVSQMAHQTIPFLDAAQIAPDAGEQQRNLQLATAVLSALQVYVNGEVKK